MRGRSAEACAAALAGEPLTVASPVPAQQDSAECDGARPEAFSVRRPIRPYVPLR